MAASSTGIQAKRTSSTILILTAIASSLTSVTLLLYGLFVQGPAFYNGSECTMTFSQFQFLPIRVLPSTWPGETEASDRYRMLKFTDARDPRHQHLYPISAGMIENYASQSKQKQSSDINGRLLEFTDNWCLLPHNVTISMQWKKAPYPHRGHPVLYVPGHWGSFSQARSIGAHGTRWTGRSIDRQTSFNHIYNSFKTGEGMHDGANLSTPQTDVEILEWINSSSILDEFVMDVYSLDFGEEGATLHASRLLRQAEFFARSIETLVQGCDIDKSNNGVTIVAHSIGAWVVRIALKMHPQLTERGWIKNIVTLASPLGGVPYAVDAGVHDIVNHVNDGKLDIGDVTFISVSGGLRDEMIPPEVCEIPSTSFDQQDVTNATSAASETFLSTTILNRHRDRNTENQYGMDHRAIVWCHDLLKVIREVIFTLAVATDQGMKPDVRLNMARRVMLGHHSEFGEQSKSRFQEEVDQQRNLLVVDRGYVNAVAIQLAAPYHLNALLKLAIAASLLSMYVLAPLKLFLGAGMQNNEDDSSKGLLDATQSLLLIPLLLVPLSSIRCAASMCSLQEYQVLLGTVLVLAQVAAIIYVLICIVLSPFIAHSFQKCFGKKTAFSKRKDETPSNTFSMILSHFMVQQCRSLIFLALPLVIGCIYTFHHFVNGNTDDLVLNRASVGSYCFISMVLLLLCCLIKSIFIFTGQSSKLEHSAVFVLLLMAVKTTCGKVLYALSSTKQSGQIGYILYDEFLKTTNSHVGTVAGHHNELIICLATKVLPAYFALNAMLTHTTMNQKARLHFSSSNNNSNGDRVLYLSSIAKEDPSERSWSLNMAKASLTIWYAWGVFVSSSQDDLLSPAYSTVIFATYYLRSIPLSSATLDIYSAVASNDLSLCCSVAKDHNKKE